jgi:hypothetical protein
MERHYKIRNRDMSGTPRPLSSGGTDFGGAIIEASTMPNTVSIPSPISLEEDASLMIHFNVTINNALSVSSYPTALNTFFVIELIASNGTTTKSVDATWTIYTGESLNVNVMATTTLTAGDWTLSVNYSSGDFDTSAEEGFMTWIICQLNPSVEDLTEI